MASVNSKSHRILVNRHMDNEPPLRLVTGEQPRVIYAIRFGNELTPGLGDMGYICAGRLWRRWIEQDRCGRAGRRRSRRPPAGRASGRPTRRRAHARRTARRRQPHPDPALQVPPPRKHVHGALERLASALSDRHPGLQAGRAFGSGAGGRGPDQPSGLQPQLRDPLDRHAAQHADQSAGLHDAARGRRARFQPLCDLLQPVLGPGAVGRELPHHGQPAQRTERRHGRSHGHARSLGLRRHRARCGVPGWRRAVRPALAAALALSIGGCGDQPEDLTFPHNFQFGTAIAGFQVDMGCPTTAPDRCNDPNSDWYVWVTKPELVNDPANQLSGDPPSTMPGFYELFAGDMDRAKNELRSSTLRLSIEWSRLFPTSTVGVDGYDALKQKAAPDALAYYHALFAALAQRGLRPLVTLNHYTLPTWIHDPYGCHLNLATCSPRGWMDSDRTIAEIAKYAGFCAREFGGEVDLWATENEPFLAVAVAGYF